MECSKILIINDIVNIAIYIDIDILIYIKSYIYIGYIYIHLQMYSVINIRKVDTNSL